MVSERDAVLYGKIRAYNEQFVSYILRKANNDSKVELAINTLAVVNLYQAMALVLAPLCFDFQAQVDMLDGVLDAVFEYLHSDSFNKEKQDQLTNEVLSLQHGFMEFIARCAGFEVKIEEITEDKLKHGLVKGKRPIEVKYLGPAKERYEPGTTGPIAIEVAQGQAKYLEKYVSQLVDYIMDKTGWDMSVPFALMGLEVSYLHNSLAPLFLFTEPGPCMDIFTGSSLEDTVLDTLRDFVKALNETYDGSMSPEEWELETIFELLDSAQKYTSWRASFISAIATCYGIDLDLVPVPKGNSMELELVKYEPLEPGTETEPGSQEAPAS